MDFCVKSPEPEKVNLNYSYRAFLITSLLFGCFILILYSIKLSGNRVDDDFAYDVELAPEDDLLEEELKDQGEEELIENAEIETHRAFNEAERYISETEHIHRNSEENVDEKLKEIDEAIARTETNGISMESVKTKSSKTENPEKSAEKTSDIPSAEKGANRRTTVSYLLKNRTHLFLPNPVYTCTGSGKIVINIEVNALGEVKKTSWNKSASTTGDQCLIDAALEYASQAKFTSDASRKKQLGTITFNFPGQY